MEIASIQLIRKAERSLGHVANRPV